MASPTDKGAESKRDITSPVLGEERAEEEEAQPPFRLFLLPPSAALG